ncbi:hypothetical protein J4G33_12205 [Actinotalea sp. BY-33]|uniref:Uncharacterized protein n=1 Tax=Actinotalea soli TaxID=2819234 RepID=A0A939LQH7_9CELL|nr:hypothetical protein [Actinotalea soli]MBO1752566.1 hypothetical protein [Actinotalea soli]
MPGPPIRRPGDGDGFDRRPDPNAGFLGGQSLGGQGGGGLPPTVIGAVVRAIRRFFGRRRN